MAVIRTFSLEREPDHLEVELDLTGPGVVRLQLTGEISQKCRHGTVLQHTIVSTIECASDMENDDLNLVEAMIRGDEWSASTFSFRLADQLILTHAEDPCGVDEEGDSG